MSNFGEDNFNSPTFEGGRSLRPVLPIFFYLTTGQSLIGIPVNERENKKTILLPYRLEASKDRDGVITHVKPFYPIPIIALYESAIAYEAPAFSGMERKYLGTILSEKKSALSNLLRSHGYSAKESIDFYKMRILELEKNS